jgi:hypothetical protein
MSRLDDVLGDAGEAAIPMIGHLGAKALEFGYANDDATTVADGDWYASAHYKGTRMTVEHFTSPGEALNALCEKLLTGGICQHCNGLVTIEDGGARAFIGQPMLDGTIMTLERAVTMPHCRWKRDGKVWQRGCEHLSRQQKRARAREAAKRGKAFLR